MEYQQQLRILHFSVESDDHDSRSDHDVDWAGRIPPYGSYREDKRVVEHLKKVNEKIVENFDLLPTEIRQAMPNSRDVEMPDFNHCGDSVPPLGYPIAPMIGGGHGEQEPTSENSSWLTEDDDVWGGPRGPFRPRWPDASRSMR
ncbi:hypothetical protein [Nonomuraea sp. NPDC049695]|uniref:hypothetical protein n=1 Tax=Nonomuraea sp. NPDC049695 TaxID=3154734 RepID=UPI0034325D48